MRGHLLIGLLAIAACSSGSPSDDAAAPSTVGYLPFVGACASALCIDREACESAPAIVTVEPGDELSRTVVLDELPSGTYRVVYPRVSDGQQTATTIEL